ncbi:MAG TPA: OmpA family protein [Phycisphaerae bacterium]|nr:OmpA family protein [Phycisphaerae bacterium]
MQKGKPFSRWLMMLAMGSLVAVAAGCGQQQLEERNMALEKQLRESLTQNADLQAENDGMRAKNEALQSDLDKARAQPQAAQQAKGKPKPEFGEGVDVSMVGDTMTVTLPDTILFDSGKATLKGSSKQVLDKIAGVLNRDYATYKIRVEGHTDDQPIVKSKKLWQDNWDLSCNRAMAVLRHLVQKGVDPKRAYAAGYSYYKPVASNSTPAGRAKNRRVAIVVAPR